MTGPEASRLAWQTRDEFSLDGIAYVARDIGYIESSPERFCVMKTRASIEAYEGLLTRLRPANIFELGIFHGGSTALVAQLAEPRKLVAVDVAPRLPVALTGFIEARGLGPVISLHSGVDQSDRSRLSRLVDDEFGTEALDLVIDDASHQLDATRAAFDALFPRLRPGGAYVIEDWSWAHLSRLTVWPRRPPLSILLFELTMACGFSPGTISGIEINHDWATIWRGDEDLDPAGFKREALYGERGRDLVAGLEQRGRNWSLSPGSFGRLRKLLRR